MRVGEKETSEGAAIVAKYEDLFTHAQRDALLAAEEEAGDPASSSGSTDCASPARAGSSRARWPSLPTRSRTASWPRACLPGRERAPADGAGQLAVLPDYGEREELGVATRGCRAGFNDDRLDLIRRIEELDAESRGSATRSSGTRRRRASRSPTSPRRWRRRAVSSPASSSSCASAGSTGCSGRSATTSRRRSTSATCAASRRSSRRTPRSAASRSASTRSSASASTSRRSRTSGSTSTTARRRARGPASSPSDPPSVVHLITRAQGGMHDYAAFLHEAGHALHYAGSTVDLPFTFRAVSRDHALTEIYSYIVEAISREPGWHERYFGLTAEQAAENAEASRSWRRCSSAATRRSCASSWSSGRRSASVDGTPGGYSELLTEASGVRYAPDNYLPTWTRASTPPTTCARGSARHSCASTCSARSETTGGRTPHGRLPARAVGRRDAPDERGDRRAGSATTRSTHARSLRLAAPDRC